MTNFDRSGLHTPQDNIPLEQTQSPDPNVDDASDGAEALFGNNPAGTAYIDQADIDTLNPTTQSDTDIGDPNNRQDVGDDTFDMLLEREYRAEETDDVIEAIEEGFTYDFPVDPPSSLDPDSGEGQRDLEPELGDDDDMTALVRQALRSDSATIGLVSRLKIATINGIVIVRGEVDDLDDTDNIVAVISEIEGVEAVRDETTVRGL